MVRYRAGAPVAFCLAGWARVPGTQSLARELSYDPFLQQLCYNPPPEMAALRQLPPLYQTGAGFTLAAGASRSLGNWTDSAGNSSEVWVRFKVPMPSDRDVTAANGNSAGGALVTFGIGIMTSDQPPHAPTRLAYVDYLPPPPPPPLPLGGEVGASTTVFNATVGVRSPISSGNGAL